MQSFTDLVFPPTCLVCKEALYEHEQFICDTCFTDMPYTDFHTHCDNAVSQIFWGRVKIEQASSLLFFTKGSHYQRLVHMLKYKNHAEVGHFLGRLMVNQWKNYDFFEPIDAIIPVPLHPKRQKKRGYNQSEKIAQGISQDTGLPIDTRAIRRITHTQTQTKQNREKRIQNMRKAFSLTDPNRIANKHVLLVDDVITTGATTEYCAATLKQAPQVHVSIASVAYATG